MMKKLWTVLFCVSLALSMLHSCEKPVDTDTSNGIEETQPPSFAQESETSVESDAFSESYSSVQREFPVEYESILNQYYDFVDGGYKTEYEENGGSVSFGIGLFEEALKNSPKETFGYGLKDINGDGILDLFLMVKSSYLSGGRKDDVTVYEIYSLHESKPVLLRDFWNRSVCVLIDEDGTIYHRGSGGAFTTYRSTHRIAEGGGELISILSLKREDVSRGEDRYYRYMDEDREKEIELIESEGIELWNQVDIDAVDNSAPGIEFIPLFNLNEQQTI